MSEVAVVDFSKCNIKNYRSASAGEIKECGDVLVEAFMKTGFAFLINTGIDQELIVDVRRAFEKFFKASEESKKKYAIKSTNHGYLCMYSEKGNYKDLDPKEGFNVRGAALTGDKDFPWPEDLSPGISKVVSKLMLQCQELCHPLVKAIAVGLNLDDEQHFVECHTKEDIHSKHTTTALRCSYYYPLQDDAPMKLRFGAHRDMTTLTISFLEADGFQFENEKGEFVDVHPVKDGVLVNVGDILEFWTKCKLRSVNHRTVSPVDEATRNRCRQSLSYYVNTKNDIPIQNLHLNHVPKECKIHKKEAETITLGDYVKLNMSDMIISYAD